jgi:hypothetical protein
MNAHLPRIRGLWLPQRRVDRAWGTAAALLTQLLGSEGGFRLPAVLIVRKWSENGQQTRKIAGKLGMHTLFVCTCSPRPFVEAGILQAWACMLQVHAGTA